MNTRELNRILQEEVDKLNISSAGNAQRLATALIGRLSKKDYADVLHIMAPVYVQTTALTPQKRNLSRTVVNRVEDNIATSPIKPGVSKTLAEIAKKDPSYKEVVGFLDKPFLINGKRYTFNSLTADQCEEIAEYYCELAATHSNIADKWMKAAQRIRDRRVTTMAGLPHNVQIKLNKELM